MKIQLRAIGVVFIILMVAWGSVHAQVVDIPDPNLRAAVRDALNLTADVPLTVPNIRRLTSLDAPSRQIEELTGLQFATNLSKLRLVFNKISDLSPLVNLRLQELWLWVTWLLICHPFLI